MTETSLDWPALVFKPSTMTFIDRMAARRFTSRGLAEEAGTYVIEHLSHDNWARCRQFNGSASPETFLRVVISRALEDFSHKRFGKPRPPLWLKNQGNTWVTIWKMICLERQLIETVKYAMGGLNHTPDEVGEIIRTIKARLPWCGEVTFERPAAGQDEGFSVDRYGATCSLEAQNEDEQQQAWLLFLASLLNNKDIVDHAEELQKRPGLYQLQQRLQAMREHLQLSDEERLLLILIYQENMKFSAAAKALSMPEHQPSRTLKRVHTRIAEAFDTIGVSVDELKQLFSTASI